MSEVRVAAGDAGFDDKIRGMAESVQARVRYHSIELPDGSVLPGLQTVDTLRRRLAMFGLPEDLSGKRVLDIGAWDGWFSFECERRGAAVVAVDCVALDTFLEAKQLLGSRVEYLTLDVNELRAANLGTFDVVLFFGVLYHLRHPLLGLERVLELCHDLALIESFVIASEAREIPTVIEFYERAELGGQIDNWCGPSPEALLAMCRSAGFAQADLLDVTSQRASVICRRHWPEAPVGAAEGPWLVSVVNSRSYLPVFHQDKDEYLCCFFKYSAESIENIMVEVDGFGCPVILVATNGPHAWQANCLRPVGLAAGRHRVTVRLVDTQRSNPVEFVVLDGQGREPMSASPAVAHPAPELCSVEYHPEADRRLSMGRAGSLIIYFRSGVAALGSSDVRLEVGGVETGAHALGSLGDGVWQVNLRLDDAVPEGTAVRVRLGAGEWSGAMASRS